MCATSFAATTPGASPDASAAAGYSLPSSINGNTSAAGSPAAATATTSPAADDLLPNTINGGRLFADSPAAAPDSSGDVDLTANSNTSSATANALAVNSNNTFPNSVLEEHATDQDNNKKKQLMAANSSSSGRAASRKFSLRRLRSAALNMNTSFGGLVASAAAVGVLLFIAKRSQNNSRSAHAHLVHAAWLCRLKSHSRHSCTSVK